MATDLGKVGIVMKGTYNSANTYEVLDAVLYNSNTYIAKQAVPAGTAPTNTTYWQLALEQQYTVYSSTSTQSVSKEIENKAVYIFFTNGGSGAYTYVWLVVRFGSSSQFFIWPLISGTNPNVSIAQADGTVTVTCSNTTIQMGYVRIG